MCARGRELSAAWHSERFNGEARLATYGSSLWRNLTPVGAVGRPATGQDANHDSAGRHAKRITRWRRPSPEQLGALRRARKPVTFRFRDDGMIPNHPRWPLVLYRRAVALPGTLDPLPYGKTFSKVTVGRLLAWRDLRLPALSLPRGEEGGQGRMRQSGRTAAMASQTNAAKRSRAGAARHGPRGSRGSPCHDFLFPWRQVISRPCAPRPSRASCRPPFPR
jgi:hypothetical protein